MRKMLAVTGAICALPGFVKFASAETAEAGAHSSDALTLLVRFCGIAVGFLIALFVTRAVTRHAEQTRKDVPHPTLAKTTKAALRYPTLVCESGPLSGERWRMEEGTVTIGRGEHCRVRFPKDIRTVSPEHCCLRYDGQTYTLTASDAVSLPDGTPVTEVTLACGDTFCIGGKKYRFRIALEE